MHSRTKSTVLNESKNLTKSSATHISNKPSKQNTATKQPANTRTSDRKIKRHEKQNIESVNVPSPQEKIKNKNFMPKIRKGSKLELSSTVSLVINESIASVKKQDLLDSLLYGQIDLTYSQELHQKEQQNEQLLILGCDQNVHFKHCKNLSPIKSISEYSLTENENQKLVIQKVESSTANSVLKIRNKITHHKFDSSQATKQIIFRRLVIYFSQNRQNLLKFYCAIHQAASNQDLYLKIRQYLFQNGIIFKKAELNGFVDLFCHLLDEVNRDKKKSQFSEQNFQIVMESIFFRVNSENTELFRNIWVIEQAHDKIFQQQDLVSIWKLIVELLYQSPHQIQSSFRQSRFCLSMDSNRFLHQTDEKSKRQNISSILEWLGHFIITQSQLSAFNTQSSIQNSETKVEIKISPPL